MLEQLKYHIKNHFPFLQGKKLLLAVSGGIDSMVLTQLFHLLNYPISIAHCNFNLRGNESDMDEKFVKELGEKLQLQTFTIHFNTEEYATKEKLSTQIAARKLRYNWFQELTIKHGFDYVLTAHHSDDNLETFLINLTRKTGLDGLTGIPSINQNIVRPLLIFSRNEIEQYAIQNNVEWREDESNTSTKYVRNKIRHQVIPVLKKINPNLLESFQQTITNLKGSQEIINKTISDLKKTAFDTSENRIVKINISDLKKLTNPKPYLFQILKQYGFTEWNDITNLLSAQSGKEVFSTTHRLLKDRDFLLLVELKNYLNNKTYFISKETKEITEPIHLTLNNNQGAKVTKNDFTIYVDESKIDFPLTLRKWKAGDYFYPLGMQGKKKVSKFFKDQKFSLIDKENTWLLCSKNTIIWIVGKRQDKRFTSKQNNLKIQLIK